MQSLTLEYTADGLPMKSDLYLPDGTGKRPGVLVFPEAFGIGEHVRTRARRLAEQGYVALACDLHGNAHRYDRIEEVMGLIGPLRGEVARIRARAAGGLEALRARPEVDPARINFVDLMNWVLALPGFEEDATHCGEKKLEAIQQAWIDEAE